MREGSGHLAPATHNRTLPAVRIDSSAFGAVEEDERRLVTALFADIVGSTALGEFLAMDEVKALVGECVTRMSEVIERFGGVVGSYMGDGVAAFFGMRTSDEHDQGRAALAALELRRVVVEYATEARSAWGVNDLSVRVGLNCGRVAIGPVGASQRQVVALGDAVNVAARLQGVADPGTIVVGAGLARVLRGRFELEGLGPVRLKGRANPIQAYRLIAESLGKQDRPVRAIVGRDAELRRLDQSMTDLTTGRGQVVLVLGEAGIGKSRLLEESFRRAPSGVLWIGVGSGQVEGVLPYGPFVDALRGWLGLDTGEPDIAVRVRLSARLAELMADPDEMTAALARFLGLPARTKHDRRLEGLPIDVLQSHLHRVYLEWLTRVAEKIPVVLAIENLGHVDEATLQLGELVLGVTDVAPVLVIATMRPEPTAPGWQLRVKVLAEYSHRAEELRLTPLSDEESVTLVSMLDEGSVLTEGVTSALVRTAEGNPLYLEEMYNAIVGGDQSFTDETLHLPPALEGLLQSRIDRLPARAREVLQAAAVLGREFSKNLVEHMRPESDVGAELSVLLRADLIRERRRDPAEYLFKHGLLREAALFTLTANRRRELHHRAAQAIEAMCGPNLRQSVHELAGHYLAAGEPARGLRYLEDLGERLADLYRYEQAIDVLEECRQQLGDRGNIEGHTRMTEKIAELRARSGDTLGAAALLDELDVRTQEAASRRLVLKARLMAEAGELQEAERLARSGLVVPAGHELEQRLLVLLAQVALRRQQFREARTCLERLADVSAMNDETAFDACSAWAGYLAGMGDLVVAKSWAERALEIARSSGRLSVELRARRQVGVLDVLNGRVRSGHDHLKAVFDTSSDLGFGVGALECGINLVHSAHLLGELTEAEDVSLQMLRLTNSPFWSVLIQSNLAAIRFEQNDLASCEQSVRAVLTADLGVATLAPRVAARVVLSRLAALDRDWETADNEMNLAREEAKGLDLRHGIWTVIRTAAGELASMRGDWSEAAELADTGISNLDFADKPLHVALFRLKGLAMAMSGNSEAGPVLARAQRMSRVMELRLEEARTLVALGIAQRGAAFEYFAEAERLFKSCGSERGLIELSEARSERARGSLRP